MVRSVEKAPATMPAMMTDVTSCELGRSGRTNTQPARPQTPPVATVPMEKRRAQTRIAAMSASSAGGRSSSPARAATVTARASPQANTAGPPTWPYSTAMTTAALTTLATTIGGMLDSTVRTWKA